MARGMHSGGSTYATIKKGKIHIKEGEEVKVYGWIEGWIRDIQIRDDEYQGIVYKKLCIDVDDGVETLQFQMKLDSGYGRAFCSIIKNVDLTKQVMFSPSYKEDENGKGEAGMFLHQDKKALKWYFTKDTPHDRPDLEKAVFKGQEYWDNTKQLNFYINMLLNEIKPNLVHAVVSGPAHQLDEKARDIPSPNDITEPIDDLPF